MKKIRPKTGVSPPRIRMGHELWQWRASGCSAAFPCSSVNAVHVVPLCGGCFCGRGDLRMRIAHGVKAHAFGNRMRREKRPCRAGARFAGSARVLVCPTNAHGHGRIETEASCAGASNQMSDSEAGGLLASARRSYVSASFVLSSSVVVFCLGA